MLLYLSAILLALLFTVILKLSEVVLCTVPILFVCISVSRLNITDRLYLISYIKKSVKSNIQKIKRIAVISFVNTNIMIFLVMCMGNFPALVVKSFLIVRINIKTGDFMVTQKEIFFQYLLNERDRLENEVAQLRQNLRMRNVDAVDCLELSLALERLSAFTDFSDHAIAIFNLSCPADYRAKIINIDFSAYKKAAEKLKKSMKEVK